MTPEQLAEWQRLERARPMALLDLRTAAGDREQYLLARARLIALNVAQDALAGAPPPEPQVARKLVPPVTVRWPEPIPGFHQFLRDNPSDMGARLAKLSGLPSEMSWRRLWRVMGDHGMVAYENDARTLWVAFKKWTSCNPTDTCNLCC